MKGSRPPTRSEHATPVRLYTRHMTPSRSSHSVESYNTARCVCHFEVKGQSCANDRAWPSSIKRQAV